MNKKLTKVVNIYPSTPITGVNPPIRSAVRHVTKSIKDIRTCIINRAKVEEILPNGNIIRLGLNNYDKENYIIPEDEVAETVTAEETTSDVTVDETDADDSAEAVDVNAESIWKTAYDEFLADKDLNAMTKKQRKDVKAEARAAADAAVAAATITVEEDVEAETVTAEETTSDVTVDETDADDSAEEVTTDDAEDLSEVIE